MESKLPMVLIDLELLILRLSLGTRNTGSQHVALQIRGDSWSGSGELISRILQMVAGVIKVCHIGQISGLVFVEVENLFSRERMVEALEARGFDAVIWKS